MDNEKIEISRDLFNQLLHCKAIAEEVTKAKVSKPTEEQMQESAADLARVISLYSKELKLRKIGLPERIALLCHMQGVVMRG